MRLTDYFRVARNSETSSQDIIKATRTYLLYLQDLFRTFEDNELSGLAAQAKKNSRLALQGGQSNLADLFGSLADYAQVLKKESHYSFSRFAREVSLKSDTNSNLEKEGGYWDPNITRELITKYLIKEVVQRVSVENDISILEAEVFVSLSDTYDFDLRKFFRA
jgi:hypothetical protein